MPEARSSRYVGWDPGKQPTKSNERMLKDMYNGSVTLVEHQSQAIRAQKPSFVAAAAKMAAAKAQPAPAQPPQAQRQPARVAPVPQRTHKRNPSTSAAAAAAVTAQASKPKPMAPSTGLSLSGLPARDPSNDSSQSPPIPVITPSLPSPCRLSLTSASGETTMLAKNAASAALIETSPRIGRHRNSSISSISSTSLLPGSPSPMGALGGGGSSTSAAAASAVLRSRQPSMVAEIDYDPSFSERDRGEASAAAMLAAPHSLGQEFLQTHVGVPSGISQSSVDLPRSSSVGSADKTAQPPAPTRQIRTAQASAAARASLLKPIEVAPREPLSSKFVTSLSASLKTQIENKTRQNEEAAADSQRARNMVIEQTAARLSAQRQDTEAHELTSQSSAGTFSPSARSALAAAVRATPLAETEVARIQEIVEARARRKRRFKPSGQWSSSRAAGPAPPRLSSDRPPLDTRWSTSTAPHSVVTDMSLPAEAATAPSSSSSDTLGSTLAKRPSFFSKLSGKVFQRNNRASREGSMLNLEATPSPVIAPVQPAQPAVPHKHLKQTMRDGPVSKKKIFNEEKPWKHHLEAHVISEKERKRYERVWAANKGSHVPFLPGIVEAETTPSVTLPMGLGEPEGYRSSQSLLSSTSGHTTSMPAPPPTIVKVPPQPIPGASAHLAANAAANNVALALSPAASSMGGHMGRQSFDGRSIQSGDTLEMYERQQLEDIHGYVVARLWRRSHLSDDVLSQVWDLVDNNQDGTLDRSSFIVGMWLVDQCLYGRKLPSRVEDSVWKSVGHLQVKIRVKKPRRKLLRVRHLRHRKRISTATSIDPYSLGSPGTERNSYLDY